MSTFAKQDSLNFISMAKNCGYKINLSMIMCDINIALERAKKREEQAKRHTPPAIIMQRHEDVAKLLPGIIKFTDEHSIFWNN